MHHSGPLPLAFEGPEQGSGGKNCQNGSRGKPCCTINFPVYGKIISVLKLYRIKIQIYHED